MVRMSEILLRSTKFNVVRREFDVPGQGSVRKDIVNHPGAVLILALPEPDRVVMIRNYRYSVCEELLELPAGTLEPPEPPRDCAARELAEETGYRAAEFEPLCEFYTSPGFTNELMHVFVARNLSPGVQNLQENEQIKVQVLSLDDALRACLDGRIRDGKTIAALQVYHYRQRGL
jgi:ADP-ribose pyrophosphatase